MWTHEYDAGPEAAHRPPAKNENG
ncbi:MAG: hypothetical protein QOJ23_5257, partial [Actinomycetota bacterium]|nr:hypothetical protein [Actinomycetota bacterium]